MGLQTRINVFRGEAAMFNKIYVHLRDDVFDTVQFRFPRTKKKRIVKKWKKNKSYYRNIPSKSLRIVSIVCPGEVMALGHSGMRQHLEYLNSIALETEGPEFIFVNERMKAE